MKTGPWPQQRRASLPEQKAFFLKQGEDGTPVAEICRKAGIGQATYRSWKKMYRGLLPDEMRRLKKLEDENARLKSWRDRRTARGTVRPEQPSLT